jgi:hypothetical protein
VVVTVDYNDRIKDPRFQRAKTLFATEVAPNRKWGSGHAQSNIEYAVCEAALGADSGYSDPDAALVNTVEFHIKPQFRAAVYADCQRVIRSAALAGEGSS